MTELPSPNELVGRYAHRARKAFGQHFLSDSGLLDRIVALVEPTPGSRLLEVGPGPGGLTTRMLATGASVVALDADPDMVEHLQEALGHVDRFEVRHADATGPSLDQALGDPPRDVVSNLPYNAGTPILFKLLEAQPAPRRMALMFQLEVAQRVVCTGPDRNFSSIGVAANLRYDTRLAFRVPPGAFRPPPKVTSAVVSFRLRDEPRCEVELEPIVRRVARTAFGQRRKMLRKSLVGLGVDAVTLCEAAEVAPTDRPEALDVEAFVRLARALEAVSG